MTDDFLSVINNQQPLVVALPSTDRVRGYDYEWVEAQQDEGNDIFYVVNELDGPIKSADKITAVNAAFIDVDGNTSWDDAPEGATIVGRDPTHWHAYWTLRPNEDMNKWRQVQVALADHFSSDPAVNDLPRLMRLPGTLNFKEDMPMEHAVIRTCTYEYTLNEIVELYDLKLKGVDEYDGPKVTLDIDMPEAVGHKLCNELDALDPSEGERYATGRRWVLRAVGAGMEPNEAREYITQAFVAWGYGAEHAKRQALNTLKGLVEKLETGKLHVDEDLRPDLVFPDEEEGVVKVGSVEDNMKLVKKETNLLDVLSRSTDPEDDLLENDKTLAKMSELEMMKMVKALKKLGRIPTAGRPADGQISAATIEKTWKIAAKDKSVQKQEVNTDPEIVAERIELLKRTYCIEKGTSFGYYLYDKEKMRLRPLGKDQEIEGWLRYINAGAEAHEATLFRERAYNDIHSKRVISAFDAVAVPYGETTVEFEPQDDGTHCARTFVSLEKRLDVFAKRYESVEIPEDFIKFLDDEYLIVWVALKAALARRFLGDKRSIIWIKCPSDWGKTFFFALDGLALFMDNGYDSDFFKGNQPADFAGLVYAWIDEAHKFTKEMKHDTLPYRKLYGGNATLRLPARLIASANSIADLEDGSDKQLINRVCRLDAKDVKLKERLDAHGWDNNVARKWYEKLVIQRMRGWLEEWQDDEVPGAGYFRSFTQKYQLNAGDDISDVIKRHFWHHFLFDHIKEGPNGGFQKKLEGWAWLDDGSDFIYLEDDVLYVKRVKKWFLEFVKRELGDDKQFMARRAAGSISDIVSTVGGNKCTALPRKGGAQRKWEGFCIDLNSAKDLEVSSNGGIDIA